MGHPKRPIVVLPDGETMPVLVGIASHGHFEPALQRAYTRAERESSVQLVTVVAEPGLGKSRLVQAFSDWVDAQEELVTWRQGRWPSYGDAVTYAALGADREGADRHPRHRCSGRRKGGS
jgi:hypothetical protein